MKSHLIVDNQYFIFKERGMSVIHAQAQIPYSYAYCCPTCGEVWCRYGVENPGTQWSFLRRECRAHATGLTIPGSIWIGYDPEFTSLFPADLLKRELELHIAFFDKATEIIGL